MEFLERELELLDANVHDEELTGLVGNVQSLVQKSKKELETKQASQKAKEVENKQKAEDAEYAYTPKEGFNWDNVSGAINDVIWSALRSNDNNQNQNKVRNSIVLNQGS